MEQRGVSLYPRSSTKRSSFVFGHWRLAFVMFARGPSRIKPPGFVAAALRLIGRHTLVIYALSSSPCLTIVIKLFPEIGLDEYDVAR
jgi:hypothetical protein